MLPTRWQGRARPNAAVVVVVVDDEEHRAEDSDAEVLIALEEAGLAVAARLVAVAFIDAIMVVALLSSFLSSRERGEERLDVQ